MLDSLGVLQVQCKIQYNSSKNGIFRFFCAQKRISNKIFSVLCDTDHKDCLNFLTKPTKLYEIDPPRQLLALIHERAHDPKHLA